MIQAQLADGTILQFPPGTPDEVVDRTVKKHIAESSAPTAPVTSATTAPPSADMTSPQAMVQSAQESGAMDASGQITAVPQTGPSSITDATGGYITPGTAEAVGGTLGYVVGAGAGGVAGLGAGPGAPAAVPAGALIAGEAGGALGSTAGRYAYDAVEDFLRAQGVLEAAPRSTRKRIENALEAGRQSLMWGPGGQIAGQAIKALKPGIGRILGVASEEAAEIIAKARRQNVDVAAQDVMTGTPKRAAEAFSSGAGIFPFIGAPARTASRQQAAQIGARMGQLLDEVAPNATLSEAGVDMVNAAKNSSEEFRKTAGELFENFYRVAEKHGGRVPTEAVKDASSDIIDLASKGQIKGADGKILPGEVSNRIIDEVTSFMKMPEYISPEQHRAQVRRLQDIMDEMGAAGSDVAFAGKLKASFEDSLSRMIGSVKSRKALEVAKNFYSKGITDVKAPTPFGGSISPKRAPEGGKKAFETQTAKKFLRTDKRIFQGGPDAPGSLNADEFTNVLRNLKNSKEAVEDMRKIVGQDVLNRYTRAVVQNAADGAQVFNKSGDLVGYDIKDFKRDIDVGSEAFGELLRNSGADPKDFRELLDLAENVDVPRDLSTFIMRRVQIGGLKSALSLIGITGGTGAAGGPAAMLIPVIMMRYGQTLLRNPEQLKELRRAFAPNMSQAQTRAILSRVLENLGDQSDG